MREAPYPTREARPGAYLWLGQAMPGNERPLHHPCYDFNDDALPLGIRWFVALVQRQLATDT